jgi:hypothetical protein
MNSFNKIKEAWKPKISEKNFRTRFIISIILLAAMLFWLARFLIVVEYREGFSFNDPLLDLFNPIDVTWLTFLLMYPSIIIGVAALLFYPEELLLTIQAYTLIIIFRLTTIFFLPIEAPATIIPLTDPFIQYFGTGRTLYNDLFFSGHTSAMFLLFLSSQSKKLKTVFLISTILVGVCVLAQHVHYTIDVLVAPFFAYTCYRIVILLNKQFQKKLNP